MAQEKPGTEHDFVLFAKEIMHSQEWDLRPSHFCLWMHLLLSANDTEHNGIKRGQVVTTYAALRDAYTEGDFARSRRPERHEVIEGLQTMSEQGIIALSETDAGLLITALNCDPTGTGPLVAHSTTPHPEQSP